MGASLLHAELVALAFALAIGVVTTLIAIRWRFFQRMAPPQRVLPLGRQVAISFLLFLAALWGAMLLAAQWHSVLGPAIVHLAGVVGATLVVGTYALTGTPIWLYWISFSGHQKLKIWTYGLLSWFIAFPWVVVMSKLCLVAESFWVGSVGEAQVAVRFLMSLKDKPFLLTASLFVVIVVAPWLEELLFRGLLQSWLRRYLAARWAIPIAALVFAGCHYAPAQGIANLEIILSLGVLGCFLGFLLEKYNSLWAPYGLHMAFNIMGSLMALEIGEVS